MKKTSTAKYFAGAIALSMVSGLLAVSTARADQNKFWPKKDRWCSAFRQAARHPGTWAPAAGAVVVAVADLDQDISDWATGHTPIFGSVETATSRSDDLRTMTHIGMVATLFVVERGERPVGEWIGRFLVQHGAAVVTTSLTAGLKSVSGRTRPDGSDSESLPSGHSSRVFSYAASGWRNLGDSDLSPGWRRGLGIGITSLAAATAWARVEAGKHYPSDVLTGVALGNFITRVVNDAFLDHPNQVNVQASLGSDHYYLAVGWTW